MYLCLCHGVTSNEVNAEIALGADSVEAVGDRCAAGTGCGMCQGKIEDLLAQAARRREAGCCGAGCGAFCAPAQQAAAVTAAEPRAVRSAAPAP